MKRGGCQTEREACERGSLTDLRHDSLRPGSLRPGARTQSTTWRPSRVYTLAVKLCLGVVFLGACSGYVDDEPEVPALVGEVERSQIEMHVPDWVGASVAAEVEHEAVEGLASVDPSVALKIYLGTWCSDSKRELSRFWKAADTQLGGFDFPVSYVGVDREKAEPVDLLEGVGLLYVPPFIVEIEGEEVGRIVEESPAGIEADLLSLMTGHKTGLITAKEELLSSPSAGSEQDATEH